MTRDKPPEARLRRVCGTIRALWVAEYRHWYSKYHGKKTDYGARKMPKWDGGVDAKGRRHEAVWPKVAAYCVLNRLDPPRLIRAYFASAKPPALPLPTYLLGPRALEVYRLGPVDAEIDLKSSLDHQIGVLQTEIFRHKHVHRRDQGEAVRAALRDGSRGFSPLFRYCVAWRGNDAVAAKPHASDAFAQYAFNPEAYDRAWGDMIPDRLRRRAARFSAQLERKGR